MLAYHRSILLLAWLPITACLPKDTRPEPGQLRVTVTSALPGGEARWSTLDGWDVHFERFLVSVRRAELDENSCVEYSSARYGRLYDGTTEGTNKLSELYSLGHCDFGFRVVSPSSDDLLGPGVTKDDQTFMRTPGSDAWSSQRGISVWVEGTAVKGSTSKHFAWAFRRRANYSNCKLETPSGTETGVVLSGGDEKSIDLRLHGEALFQDHLDPTMASLRFETFAQADDQYGNSDGEITLDELLLVPLDAAGVEPGDAGAPIRDAGSWASFGDWVYIGLVPQITRYRDSGECYVTQDG